MEINILQGLDQMTVIYVKVQLSVMVWRSRGTREGRINSNESVLLGLEKKKPTTPKEGWKTPSLAGDLQILGLSGCRQLS